MAARAVPAPLAAIPNLLTIGRLILIPVFVVLVLVSDGGHSWPAAIVFGVAGVTDQIDGWLARRWHVESEFGKIADPLADRLMIDAAVILLWHAGRLPWVALAIPARDLALDRRVQAGRGTRVRASRSTSPARRRPGCSTPRSRSSWSRAREPTGRAGSSGPASSLAAVSLVGYLAKAKREVVDGVKAVVMAGGEGTRLRPLTSNQPKPMVPVVGKPCMEHIVELLRGHGMEDVIVTVAFLPQAIRSYFGDGESLGVNIEYSVEESPLGTAGSVRLASGELDDTFLVISGDALTAMSNLQNNRRLPPREGRRGHDRAQVGREPARVRDRRHRRATAGSSASSRSRPGARSSPTRSTPASTCSSRRCCATCPPTGPYDFSKELFPLLLEMGRSALRLRLRRATGRTSATSTSSVRRTSTRWTRRVQPERPGHPPARERLAGGGVELDDLDAIEAPAFVGNYARIRPGATVGGILGPRRERDTPRAGADRAARVIDAGDPHRPQRPSSRAAIIGRSCDIRHARPRQGGRRDRRRGGPGRPERRPARVSDLPVQAGRDRRRRCTESLICESRAASRLFGPERASPD